MNILIFCDYYLPGYKSGGPVKSISGLVDRFGNEFRFQIVTRDRDAGDTAPYPGIEPGRWKNVGCAEVLYLAPRDIRLHRLHRIISRTPHDVLYLNSYFSRAFTIRTLLLRRLGLISSASCVVAPRGEFSAGALAIRKYRKQLYMAAANSLHLYRDVIWHVSSEYEQEDVRRNAGVFRGGDSAEPVAVVAPALPVIAPDLPDTSWRTRRQSARSPKVAGALELVFLSRIARKKNLSGALSMLQPLRGSVRFNIYGPVEDLAYWSECQREIAHLPPNIEVQYQGALEPAEVPGVLGRHELFFLPTSGENFGHVIFEALAAGCPVLTSDQTAWRQLRSHGIGWDLPLDKPVQFIDALQEFIDMDNAEFLAWSRRALAFAEDYVGNEAAVSQNRQLFLGAAHCSPLRLCETRS